MTVPTLSTQTEAPIQVFAAAAGPEQIDRTTHSDEIRRLTATPDFMVGSVYPLEDARARATYGRPSAINELLIVNAEAFPGRTTVLLLREAIGF